MEALFRRRPMRSMDWLTLDGRPSEHPPEITLAPGVSPATGSEPASGIAERLLRPGRASIAVGAVIPTGFAAYARVFHPAYLGDRPVKWADVAKWSGRVVHAQMQWEAITLPAHPAHVQPPWDYDPERACPPQVRSPLTDVLRDHTSTPERCWVCVWDGYGGLEEVFAQIPRVHHPGRDYALLRASLDSIAGGVLNGDFWAQPNIWWPEDRAWCVATEIDFVWTYVAGTAECIGDVLADARLEASATETQHIASYDGDVVNGPVRP